MCIDPSGFGSYHSNKPTNTIPTNSAEGMRRVVEALDKWPHGVQHFRVLHGRLYESCDGYQYNPPTSEHLRTMAFHPVVSFSLTRENYNRLRELLTPVETVVIPEAEFQATILKAQAEVLTELKQLAQKITERQHEASPNCDKWNSARVIIEKVGVTTFFQFDKTGLEKYISNLIDSKTKFRVEYLYN